jgi:thiamine biosynthesis lipoprotein
VSTSGNYEQGAHILDPRSGQRVIRSGGVSVIGDDLTTADALATAFFVMGKEESERTLKNFPGLEVIWLEPPDHRP